MNFSFLMKMLALKRGCNRPWKGTFHPLRNVFPFDTILHVCRHYIVHNVLALMWSAHIKVLSAFR